MIFSINKLKELANLQQSPEVIIETLISLGFEIESSVVMPEVENLKFGQIIEIKKNPNASNLWICHVNFEDKVRIIQTSDNSVAQDQYVIACVKGSKIGKTIFQNKVFYDVESQGMLCSLSELGLEKESKTIYSVGEIDLSLDPISVFALNDTMIDVNILPNRYDACSYLTLANELAAFFGTKFNTLQAKPGLETSLPEYISSSFSSFIVVDSIDLTLSDKVLLMKSKLNLTFENLVLIWTGQPINIYDKNKVGNKINLDLISNIGIDAKTEYKPNNLTSEFLLEFSQPNLDIVKENQKSLTEICPKTKQWAKLTTPCLINRAIEFVKSIKSSSKIINPRINTAKFINFSIDQIKKIAGFTLPYDILFPKLEQIGFQFSPSAFAPPFYRPDVNNVYDLVEDLLRFYDYNRIPLIENKVLASEIQRPFNFSTILKSNGYFEVLFYLLTSKEQLDKFNLKSEVVLSNSFSSKRKYISNSYLPQMLEVIDYHLARNMNWLSFFSIAPNVNKLEEKLIFATNRHSLDNIKTLLNNLYPNLKYKQTKDRSFAHPGISADIYHQNKVIGWIGRLNPYIQNSTFFYCEILIDSNKKTLEIEAIEKTDNLKSIDLTFKIQKNQTLESELSNIEKNMDIIFLYVLDRYSKDDNTTNITVRIIATSDNIEKIKILTAIK
ncbi:MAG: hypothetical protein E7Y34_00790 [Mycoplasma sp.]|nr:hypothetical protein [Mycoplasma sp.]